MTRSGVRTTVKVRIKTEVLTARKKRRLEQITGRDTRTIHHFLKVINHNEDHLISVKNRTKKVNTTKLDQLTLTTTKNTVHTFRTKVRHDLKRRFPRSSHDELQECRDNATTLYHSQQSLTSSPNKKIKKLHQRKYLEHNQQIRRDSY